MNGTSVTSHVAYIVEDKFITPSWSKFIYEDSDWVAPTGMPIGRKAVVG